MIEVEIEQSSKSYPIIFCENEKEIARHILKLSSNKSKYFLIVGENVDKLYSCFVCGALEKAGVFVEKIVIPSGEQYKNLDTYEYIVKRLIEKNIDRNSCLISLGGGVTGDITGFLASTILRGVFYIQVPTTLLAQVDASVGGKTGVNLDKGKNLIGSFYQPSGVLISTMFHKTISKREWNQAMAEIIKYAICFDSNLFKILEKESEKIIQRDEKILKKIIEISLKIKVDIIQKDEKEKNVRKFLNFGHTFGHALEAKTAYKKYLHGEAISLGIVYALKLSEKYLNLSQEISKKIINLLEKYNLPTKLPENLEDYMDYLIHDKKKSNSSIGFILLQDLFKPVIYKIDIIK